MGTDIAVVAVDVEVNLNQNGDSRAVVEEVRGVGCLAASRVLSGSQCSSCMKRRVYVTIARGGGG